MGRVLFFLPLIGSVIGGLILLFTVGGAKGAPQEAAGAAIAMAVAVLPYVLCRSVQLMAQESRNSATDRLIEALRESRGAAPRASNEIARNPIDLSKIEPLSPHKELDRSF